MNSAQGELEHRRVKRLYSLTNKNSIFAKQIAQLTRRQHVLHKLGQGHQTGKKPASASQTAKSAARALQLEPKEREHLAPSAPQDHYQVSEDQRHHMDIREFVYENRHDPACQVRGPDPAY